METAFMKIRINSRSLKVASFTKNYLERKLKYPFEYGVSSRNLIMLDFDCPEKPRRCIEEARATGRALVEEYGGDVCVYVTPNGYHLIYFRFLKWSTVKKILRRLRLAVDEGVLMYLDKNHLEACLRRGYMTLRLGRQRKIWCYSYGVERRY